MKSLSPRLQKFAWVAIALFAIGVYFFNLDGLHIPKNGDEYPYAHITRLTAASGHLLPLQSELEGMRNTKPPMLFWQGIVATQWGSDWTLWQLRMPSVLYTLATALLVGLLSGKISKNLGTGVLAGIIYLAFFSTYRFGRPFLTNSPEIFWLFSPFFLLLFRHNGLNEKILPLLLGCLIGVGLLYKSFALLLPVGATLAWWYLLHRQCRVLPWLKQDGWKLILIAGISLTLFSLWFLLDPHPEEIWSEFILKENAGKFQQGKDNASYMGKLLRGPSSFWVLLFGYPFNGGLLAFPIFGLITSTLKKYKSISTEEKMLWILMIVFVAVFTLPSQRSARYLLPAMPALAILCALNWQKIHRAWFIASQITALLLLGLIGFLAYKLQAALNEAHIFSFDLWLCLGLSALGALLAIFRQELTRVMTPLISLAVFLCGALFLDALDGPLGTYAPSVQQQLVGKTVAVPYNFNGKFEAYRFLLPGAEIRGYREQASLSLQTLTERNDFVVLQLPINAPLCDHCTLLGERLEFKERQNREEIIAILHGDILKNLLTKEIIVSTHPQ